VREHGEQQGRTWLDVDEIEVLRSFTASGVRFLVIGGRAVLFHGHARQAKDLDLLVEFSAVNWERLATALQPLNASVPPFATLSAEKRYQAKLAFYPTVEFLTSIEGVSFEQAWTDAVETVFGGIQVRVISKEHLIRSPNERCHPVVNSAPQWRRSPVEGGSIHVVVGKTW
jgi:hypothetical protein